MADLSVGTAAINELRDLSRAVRNAGDRQLAGEMKHALERAAMPLKDLARQSAAQNLPRSGGRAVRKTRLVRTGVKVVDGVEYVTRRRVRTSGQKDNESLSKRVSQARFSTQLRATQLRLIAKDKKGKTADLNALDIGRFRHPVFGRRKVWVAQTIRPGWWTDVLSGSAALAEVRAEIRRAVERIATSITDT